MHACIPQTYQRPLLCPAIPCSYNLRVVECRLAAMVLAAALGATPADAAAVKTLKDVEPLIEGRYGPGAAPRAAAVAELLHEGTYGVEEVSMRALCK